MNGYEWRLKYRADQPREPSGSSEGGRWTLDSGSDSPLERALRHLAKVRAEANISEDLAQYDVSAGDKIKLADVVSYLDEARLPGKVTIIGGIARRGHTGHDIDIMVDAPDNSLEEITAAIKPFERAIAKHNISIDAYIHHANGWSAGNSHFWVTQTHQYQDGLRKRHEEWAYEYS